MGDDAATPLMSAGARRLVLLAAAACLLPLLLRLTQPLGTGFGLGALVVAGLAWQRPLPALLRLLLGAAALLAVAWVSPGIGRDTACAVLAAMLALKVGDDWRAGRPFPLAALRSSESFLGIDGPFRFTGVGRVARAMEVRRITANGTEIVDPAPESVPVW